MVVATARFEPALQKAAKVKLGAAGGGGAGEHEAEVQRKKHAAVDCAFAVEKRGLLGGLLLPAQSHQNPV